MELQVTYGVRAGRNDVARLVPDLMEGQCLWIIRMRVSGGRKLRPDCSKDFCACRQCSMCSPRGGGLIDERLALKPLGVASA